ncbi:Chromate resistance protein ChrB [Isoptericola sp. NPDC056578]|uniref:Chromate resistance protein ChrB n=1 Tax=Isoptericola sp. NPDC056578 TaxID=3345870 RepID=UPI003699FFD2
MSGEWVLLSYRLPREPSAPRVALWRRLKRLGAAQVSDGLVALPADARTREQLEWACEEVVERGGSASVWLARPSTSSHERELASAMAADRAAEWVEVSDAARIALDAAPTEQRSALTRLRRASRQVARRDFFPTSERDAARSALRDLEVQVATYDDAPAGRSR